MEINFYGDAIKDLSFWRKSGNVAVQKKLTQLFESTLQDPYKGIGKPEALKYELSGKWSRRINEEHRMVYEVSENEIKVFSLRGHYS